MVLGNSRRRYLTRLPLKSVEACGLVTDPSFNRLRFHARCEEAQLVFEPRREVVLLLFHQNSVKHLIVIEPSDEMVEMIRSATTSITASGKANENDFLLGQ